MDTAVEEDTEEERKMPLAIMQGYMTIVQVRDFLKSTFQIFRSVLRIMKDCGKYFHF